MKTKVVHAVLGSSLFDLPAQHGGVPTRLTIAMLVDPITLQILSYAIAPAGQNGKELATAFKEGIKALRTHPKKTGRLKLQSIFIDDSPELRVSEISNIAVEHGITLAYSRLGGNKGAVERAFHFLSSRQRLCVPSAMTNDMFLKRDIQEARSYYRSPREQLLGTYPNRRGENPHSSHSRLTKPAKPRR